MKENMSADKRFRKKRTRRTPEQQAEHDQEIIDKFDAQYPIGKTVWFWTTLPFGPVKETKIRDSAWVIPSDLILCKVDGVSGGVSIFHIAEGDDSRRDQIRFVDRLEGK